jgi:predicted anti-sigma-YlaC factor YlaD
MGTMNACLEADDLVALGAAVHWDVDDVLEHLAACEGCREQLRGLRAAYHAAAATMTPAAGFSDAVMNAIGERNAARRSPRFRMTALLTPALAAMTAFFAVLMMTSGDAATLAATPVFAICVAAGLATRWWNRLSMSTVPPT